MKCPKCQHNLQAHDFKGVKIHECEHCDGKWFDRTELHDAIARTDNDLRWLNFDLFDEDPAKYKETPSDKVCPTDKTELVSLHYMDSKVIIEKCDRCKGVWLDNAEFEKIIAYLEKLIVNESSSDYAKESIKEFEEIFIGSASKISEMKDFFAVIKLFDLRLQAEHPWTVALSNDIYKYWPVR